MANAESDKVNVKKSPGRKRRAAGWTLLALGVGVAGVWAASRWWIAGFYSSDAILRVQSGVLYCWTLEKDEPGSSVEWKAGRFPLGERKWIWWQGWKTSRGRGDLAVGVYAQVSSQGPVAGTGFAAHFVVIWPIPLLLWTPAALLLRSGILARRRAVSGCCGKCGYSLAGLGAGAACPECGKRS